MADSIVAPYGLETNNPVPEIKRYFNLAETPYTSTAQVLSEVLLAVRYKGQTFNVNEEEWWFKEGTADGDLVLKLSALSSNLTDGQELDLPYVGSQTFTLPDNYLVVLFAEYTSILPIDNSENSNPVSLSFTFVYFPA